MNFGARERQIAWMARAEEPMQRIRQHAPRDGVAHLALDKRFIAVNVQRCRVHREDIKAALFEAALR